MLGLWTLAAQRACHCRACLRASNLVAGRATANTASNPRRRKLMASDVFTACYTAIMATAAVLDARRKDKRRRELDDKIAEARSSLAVLLEESQARDLMQVARSSNADFIYEDSLDKLDTLKAMCNIRPEYLEKVVTMRQSRQQALQHLRTSLGLAWYTGFSEGTSTMVKCEEILASEERNPSITHREPRTQMQLEKATNMVNDLVDRLQEEAYWQSETEAPGAHPSLNSPDSARTMIRLLRSDGYPAYNHPLVDPTEAAEARAQLNEINSQILAGWTRRYREHLVAKICYNLLVCGVPPAIQNYNVLILRFAQLGEHRLAQAVVDSFIHKSHFKPTEATFLCLLHHYRLKRDIVGFWGILRRFFGHDPRGIGLRRRQVAEVAESKLFRSWFAAADCNISKGYVVECVAPNQNIIEAMMEGLIDFSMIREAAKLLAVCFQEKWTISVELLRRLLHACLTSLDNTAAKIIVQGLVNNIDEAMAMILNTKVVADSLVRQLRHVVNLCQAASLPNHRLYDGDSRPLGPAPLFPDSNLGHLAFAIWIRETRCNIRIMTEKIRRVELAIMDSTKPLGARLDKALSILNLETKRQAQKQAKTELMKRLAHITWLEQQCKQSARTIQLAEQRLCDILLEGVPRVLQTTMPQFAEAADPAVPLARRIALALELSDPRTPQYQVGACLTASEDIDLELKLLLYDALPKDLAQEVWEARDEDGDVSLEKVIVYFEEYLERLRAEEEAEEESRRSDRFAKLLEALPAQGMAALWKKQPASF
ncbi:hypothetical protein VTK26DRAFT_5127 [Humicola hyalothermophila]